MKKGFTLLEILFAMSILGLIAAFTVPQLVTNYTHRVYVRSLQSVHDSLKFAVNQTFTLERVPSLADSTLSTSPKSFMRKNFQLVDECETDYTNCLADSYKSLDKKNTTSTGNMIDNSFYCGVLYTGTVICLNAMTADSDTEHGKSTLVVDVNGPSAPNINGRDLFGFEMYSDGKIGNQYTPSEDDTNGTTCSNYASTAGYGGACYSKIVADGWKMNY